MVRACDYSQTLALRVKSMMFKEAADINRRVVLWRIQPHETIARMTQVARKEISVASEEGWTWKTVKQWNNIVILDAGVGDLVPNLPVRNSPCSKKEALVCRKVLVQQVQAAAKVLNGAEVSSTSRPLPSNHAFLASWTASATAASGMRPLHRVLQIKSHDLPAATSFRTWKTMMRVPLKVGLPWQISGSATMYLPSSIRWAASFASGFRPFILGQFMSSNP